MDDRPVIRLFRFRAVRPAFDGILRDELIPELSAQVGITDCYSGRQGPDEVGPRLVASVWSSVEAMTAALGDGLGVFHPEYLDETTDQVLEVLPLEIGERFEVPGPARILRTLRGTVRPGELDAYLADVGEGVGIDAASPNGPVALYLATISPQAFITVSAWRQWSDIELATGGDVRRPRATSRPEHLVDWTVDHFEVVADSSRTARRAVVGRSTVDGGEPVVER